MRPHPSIPAAVAMLAGLVFSAFATVDPRFIQPLERGASSDLQAARVANLDISKQVSNKTTDGSRTQEPGAVNLQEYGKELRRKGGQKFQGGPAKVPGQGADPQALARPAAVPVPEPTKKKDNKEEDDKKNLPWLDRKLGEGTTQTIKDSALVTGTFGLLGYLGGGAALVSAAVGVGLLAALFVMLIKAEDKAKREKS